MKTTPIPVLARPYGCRGNFFRPSGRTNQNKTPRRTGGLGLHSTSSRGHYLTRARMVSRSWPQRLGRWVGECNLPGWRWATIIQVALDRLSRSLHSDVCDSDGCRDAVAHSRISGRGSRRANAASNNLKRNLRNQLRHSSCAMVARPASAARLRARCCGPACFFHTFSAFWL